MAGKEGPLLSNQAIMNAVSALSANGAGFLMVSTVNAGGTLTFGGDAVSNRVSAFQTDAGSLHVSAYAGDAGLFRVSAIGGTAGDNILVDGTTQSISATLTPVSANPAGTVAGLVVNAKNYDAGVFRVSTVGGSTYVSAFIDNGSVSAKSSDAGTFHVSSFIDSGSVSARSADANQFHVSAVQGDAGLFHVSAIGTITVSAHEVKQSDAASLRVSAILDSGSVSAIQPAANALRVSAFSNDGALFRVSSIQGDAVNQNVSAKSSDSGTFLVSAKIQADARTAGGASIYMTSSGATSQVSTVKASGGRLYGWYVGNPAGVDQYLQIFNTSAGATAGTDTPTMTLFVPTLGGANCFLGDVGVNMTAGIQVIGTSTANGQTMGASALRMNIFYA